MANTVRIYNRTYSQLWSGAIGSASLAEGIWYDGHVWYLLDSTSDTIEAYSLVSGSFVAVRTLRTGLPTGYAAPVGLTGDARCLYVACKDSGLTNIKVIQFDKEGTLLAEVYSVSIATLGNVYEIDFDGHYIHLNRSLASEPSIQGLVKIEREAGVRVFSAPDTGRNQENYFFDGLHPCYGITIAGNRISVSDEFYTSKLMQNSGALGQASYGGCMLGDSSHEDSHLYDGFSSGERFALVTRA